MLHAHDAVLHLPSSDMLTGVKSQQLLAYELAQMHDADVSGGLDLPTYAVDRPQQLHKQSSVSHVKNPAAAWRMHDRVHGVS